MTETAHITITRPAAVTQDSSGAFSGGSDTAILSGWCDYQPMSVLATVHLDGTAIAGVNGKVFYPVFAQVATVNVDDMVSIVDEYRRTYVGTVVATRAFDGTILVRVS